MSAAPRPAVAVEPYGPQHAAACAAILAALPEWFALPDANAAFLRDLAALPSWVALAEGRVAGMATLRAHGAESSEISFLAVAPAHHRRGVGRALVTRLADEARRRGARVLHVKTLGPSRPDPHYAATRAFWRAAGFVPLFETTALWGPENPALVMVRPLGGS